MKRILSLPREVFRGFTAAKTSIIYALWGNGHGEEKQNKLSARNAISYVEIKNDGRTLDKKRDPLPGQNDLDLAVEHREAKSDGYTHYASAKNLFSLKPVFKNEFATKFTSVSLRDLVKTQRRRIIITADIMCREPGMCGKTHRIYLRDERYGFNVSVVKRFLIKPDDLVFATLHTQNGLFAHSDGEYHSTGTHLICIVDETKIDRDFLFWALDIVVPTLSKIDTTGRENYKEHDILNLKIPLPSLSEQREIVHELMEAKFNMIKAEANFEKERKVFFESLAK